MNTECVKESIRKLEALCEEYNYTQSELNRRIRVEIDILQERIRYTENQHVICESNDAIRLWEAQLK